MDGGTTSYFDMNRNSETPNHFRGVCVCVCVCVWVNNLWEFVHHKPSVKSFKNYGISYASDGVEDEAVFEESNGRL
jgi:hypothetical protein